MEKKTILVTGASGYIGSTLIRTVQERQLPIRVFASCSDPDKLEKRFPEHPALCAVSRTALEGEDFPWESVDVAVHLAFARRFRPDSEIADSIAYARRIFEKVRDHKVPGLIYISSQGVYGNTAEMRDLDTTVAPASVYTMAKYAGEEVLKAVMGEGSATRCAVLRLDSIAGNQKMLPAFVQQAMTNAKIKVVGGGQIFSFMDVRDAATAILNLAQLPTERWGSLYNVGWNRTRYTIVELAEIVKEVAAEFGVRQVTIEREPREIEQYAGMVSEAFLRDTGWRPQYDMHDIVRKLFCEYREKGN